MFLENKLFKNIVEFSPLIAIDLCILSEVSILLGKRKNAPAQDCFFVPGGRIRKNETIENAFNRILQQELNLRIINKKEKKLLDIYEHFYTDNFLNNKEFSTHYVVLTYVIYYSNLDKIDMVKRNEQHSKYIWHNLDQNNQENFKIHDYTKIYLSHIKNSINLG